MLRIIILGILVQAGTVGMAGAYAGATAEVPGDAVEVSHTVMAASVDEALAALETRYELSLGVSLIDTETGENYAYRGSERFPMNSTFKTVLAAGILEANRTPEAMEREVLIRESDIVPYAPVTEKHVGGTMTLAELCRAALQHSDNAAANLLLREMDGPQGLTAYARAQGDDTFRLDRWEVALNDNPPGDLRDTTTPEAMARLLQRILLGDALPQAQREQLIDWMCGNTTGDARIRAGVPDGWTVADKTGSSNWGAANDVAVIWPPVGPPLVLVVFSYKGERGATSRDEAVAEATRTVLRLRTRES